MVLERTPNNSMLLQNEAVVPEVISYFVTDFFHPSTTFISIGIYRNLAVIFKGKSFILCLMVDDLFRKINVAFSVANTTNNG